MDAVTGRVGGDTRGRRCPQPGTLPLVNLAERGGLLRAGRVTVRFTMVLGHECHGVQLRPNASAETGICLSLSRIRSAIGVGLASMVTRSSSCKRCRTTSGRLLPEVELSGHSPPRRVQIWWDVPPKGFRSSTSRMFKVAGPDTTSGSRPWRPKDSLLLDLPSIP